jgi:hypothetical protein
MERHNNPCKSSLNLQHPWHIYKNVPSCRQLNHRVSFFKSVTTGAALARQRSQDGLTRISNRLFSNNRSVHCTAPINTLTKDVHTDSSLRWDMKPLVCLTQHADVTLNSLSFLNRLSAPYLRIKYKYHPSPTTKIAQLFHVIEHGDSFICFGRFGVPFHLPPGAKASSLRFHDYAHTQSVGLLWTSYQPGADPSTWEHRTLPIPCRQEPSGWRLTT